MAGKFKGQSSPMDGKNHMEIFHALIKAGAQGMHNKPTKKEK